MAKQDSFQGDAAFLNGTAVGTLLLEIGRLHVPNEPLDPEEAFNMRINAYVTMLRTEVEKLREANALEVNPRPLRTLGWLERFLGIHAKTWRTDLQNFLRGMVRYSIDHSEARLN